MTTAIDDRTAENQVATDAGCSSADDPTTEAIFQDFWKEIVCPDGVWNFDQLKKELADFKIVMDEVSSVYDHVTGGKLSKLTTRHQAVIDAADEHYQQLHELGACECGFKDSVCAECGVPR